MLKGERIAVKPRFVVAEKNEAEPEQIVLMKRLVKMSADRSEMSAARNYMNAERTLSVWVRTALALMVFGIAMDRFGLLLHRLPNASNHLNPNRLSTWGGAVLVALGVIVAVTTGIRFLTYAVAYRRNHQVPVHHGPFLGPFFALSTALFGLALLILLLFFTE
ncbi:MAG: DUF202 domain-containing protein [Gammaproteobacteria bacterium]